MSPETFARMDDLFNAALERAPEDRSAFLARECGSDAQLLQSVEAMLAADSHDGATIDSALMDGAEKWVHATEQAAIGQRLGPYRITEFLGRGGMGAVYRAVRDDATFQKDVAIKLLRQGLDSASVLRRFEQERQILAQLEHPHIARLLDGGTAPNGLPYLVMEFVDGGVTATQYCQDSGLDLERRLLLFLDICSAVEYAHRSLIVHRDLKPGNILVDKAGSVKLLDFGIARVLSDSTDQTLTVVGGQMLTPEYASPEQVRGEPVSTATDVYSLGLILYELLTGCKGQKIEDTSLTAMARVICETVPLRPSLVSFGPNAVRPRQLAGDLDNIVLKALHKERERRYTSVEQFAEDLRAYLQGKPVKARPDSYTYRTSKFLGRNRLPVALGTVAVVSLVAGGLLLWRQAQATRRQFDQVRYLSNAFLFEFHDAVENLPGGLKARKLIVEKGLQYLRGLAADAGSDSDLQREVGLGYLRVGDVQGSPDSSNVGDTNGAMDSYKTAVRLLNEAWRAQGGKDRGRKELQEAYFKLGSLQRYANDSKGSLESYQLSLLHGESLVKTNPGDVESLKSLARVYGQLGRTYGLPPAEAIANTERAVKIQEDLTFLGVGDAKLMGELASTYATLGIGQARQGKLAEALATYNKSLALQERLLSSQPNDVSRQRAVMIAMSHVGDTLGNPDLPNLGRYAEAGEVYAKVVAIARRLVTADLSDKRAPMDLAFGLARYANTIHAAGDQHRSLQILAECLQLFQIQKREDPGNSRTLMNMAVAYSQAAEARQSLGQWLPALAEIQTADLMLDDLLRKDPRDNTLVRVQCSVQSRRVELLAQNGKLAETIEAIKNLDHFLQHPLFQKSKETRARACAPRAYGSIALAYSTLEKRHGGEGERTYLDKADDSWARMAADGVLSAQLQKERAGWTAKSAGWRK